MSLQNSSNSYRKIVSAEGIVDGSGTCEIDIEPPPTGSFYTGTITIYDAPPSIIWAVALDGVQIGKIPGNVPYENVQLGQGERVTLTATQLQPYIGQKFHATFYVIDSPESDTNLLIPGSTGAFGSGGIGSAALGNRIVYQSGLQGVVHGLFFNTPILDITGLTELLLQVIFAPNLGGMATVNIDWFEDSLGQNLITNDTFYKNGGAAQVPTSVMLAPKGPYLQIQFQNNEALNFEQISINVFGFATNYERSKLIVPQVLLDVQSVNFGAGQAVYPILDTPGLAKMWAISNITNPSNFYLQQWTGAAWDYINGINNTALGVTPTSLIDVVLPLNDWRVIAGVLSNTDFISISLI